MPQGRELDLDDQIGALDEASDETSEEITHSNGTQDKLKLAQLQAVTAQILADPNVQAVIKARREGKSVKVSYEEETSTDNAEQPEEDLVEGLDEKDPSREVLKRVNKLLTRKVDKLVEELDERLKGVESVSQEVTRRDVRDQVEAAKKRFKDLDQYRDKMVELSEKHEGLGVEELYLLAKHKSGKLRLAEQATFSEKPSAMPVRGNPGQRRGEVKVRPRGRAGFTQMLSESLDRNTADLPE